MISFRYLVVTVVAVFLALGLGVIAGTTVLDQTLVEQLRAGTERAERRARELDAQVQDVQAANEALRSLLDQFRPHLVDGRLEAETVLLVSHEGADPDAMNEARSALADAGADVREIQVTSGVASLADESRRALAEVVGADPTLPPGQLVEAAAVALADRLTLGPPLEPDDPQAPDPAPDLLQGLLQGEFLFMPGVEPSDLPAIGGDGQALVVVAGGEADAVVPVEGFMVPFVERLHADPEVQVVAAEGGEAQQPFVGILREDPEFSTEGMVTLDALDAEHFGGVALVLGLQRLIETGLGGDYGVLAGADGLLPPPVPS